MPALSNARHERFAQELAKGLTATEAYVLAGYKPDDGNASKLAAKETVQARVQEITGNAASQVAEKIAVDKAWVIERLVQNVERAMQTAEVKDSRGIGTGEFKYEGSVANRALELLGKELGMFVDRTEDVTPSRHIKQIDDRIRQFLGSGAEARAAKPARRAGTGSEGDETFPTIPGYGTA